MWGCDDEKHDQELEFLSRRLDKQELAIKAICDYLGIELRPQQGPVVARVKKDGNVNAGNRERNRNEMVPDDESFKPGE